MPDARRILAPFPFEDTLRHSGHRRIMSFLDFLKRSSKFVVVLVDFGWVYDVR